MQRLAPPSLSITARCTLLVTQAREPIISAANQGSSANQPQGTHEQEAQYQDNQLGYKAHCGTAEDHHHHALALASRKLGLNSHRNKYG